MPDVEIDIDDLLDANSEEERASKLQVNSFQDLGCPDHGCLSPLGSPKPGYQLMLSCGSTGSPQDLNNGIEQNRKHQCQLLPICCNPDNKNIC